MKKNLSVVLFCLLFISCHNEDTNSREYPRLRTWAVTDIASTSATYHGEITFTSYPISEYGFIWSTYGSLTLNDASKISLGNKNGSGAFETVINYQFEKGVKYFVKSYAISNNYTVYGDIIEFVAPN